MLKLKAQLNFSVLHRDLMPSLEVIVRISRWTL